MTRRKRRDARSSAPCNFPQPALLIKKRKEEEKEKRSARNRISVSSARYATWRCGAHHPRGECVFLVNAVTAAEHDLRGITFRSPSPDVSTVFWFSLAPRPRGERNPQKDSATCIDRRLHIVSTRNIFLLFCGFHFFYLSRPLLAWRHNSLHEEKLQSFPRGKIARASTNG